MHRTLAGRFCLCTFAITVALNSVSSGQTRHGFPTPPEPAVRDSEPASPRRNHAQRLDRVVIEREAKEMAALAATIPGDIEQMKKGLLSSDTFDKLKRIEKLSKQLRGQLHP